MDVSELEVRMPFERLIYAATYLGSQDTAFCPPVSDECWLHRDLAPYLKASKDDPISNECTECWLRFFLTGD